jgi:hypothetical protein
MFLRVSPGTSGIFAYLGVLVDLDASGPRPKPFTLADSSTNQNKSSSTQSDFHVSQSTQFPVTDAQLRTCLFCAYACRFSNSTL